MGIFTLLQTLGTAIWKDYNKSCITYFSREGEMTPHFTFELHIILVKFGEQPVHMTRRTLDVYMSVTVDLAYNMAKSYIDQGWMIERIECRDFEFLKDITTTWSD